MASTKTNHSNTKISAIVREPSAKREDNNLCKKYDTLKLSLERIAGHRKDIYGKICKIIDNPNNIQALTAKNLKYMFDLYDNIFFDDILNEVFDSQLSVKGKKYIFDIKYGNGTRNAGCCSLKPHEADIYRIKILLSLKVFQEFFTADNSMRKYSAGLPCDDQLQALMLTLEHEIIHLIIYIWEYASIKQGRKRSVHGSLFKKLSGHIFGHLDFKHSLNVELTEDPEDYKKKVLDYLEVGKIVLTSVKDNDGTYKKFQVVSINRAKNSRTFSGLCLETKKNFRVSITSVIISECQNESAESPEIVDNSEINANKQEVQDYIDYVKNNVIVGQKITFKYRDKDKKVIEDTYIVEKINKAKNAKNLRAKKNNLVYKVPLFGIILPNKKHPNFP